MSGFTREISRYTTTARLRRKNEIKPSTPMNPHSRLSRVCLSLAAVAGSLSFGACTSTSGVHPAPAIVRVLPAGAVAPRVLQAVEPEYPDAMRRSGHEGVVRVTCLIGEDGDIRDAGVLWADADSWFAAQAVAAVTSWRFAPGTRDGKPVAMQIVVPIRFTLSADGERKTTIADVR